MLEVPVTISAFSAARQALGLAENIGIDAVPYVLRGKLAGGLFGTQRFVEKGTIDLSPALTSPIAAPESYDHITKNATILRQRSVRWRHRAKPKPPANSSLYRTDTGAPAFIAPTLGDVDKPQAIAIMPAVI